MSYDWLCIGMPFNVTQVGAKTSGKASFSHPSYEIDLAGASTAAEPIYNCMPNTYWKVAGRSGNKGTYYFWSVDENGNPKRVLCADGILRLITLAMTHSAIKIEIGKIIKPFELMYTEGILGLSYGAHLHLEIAEGHVKSKIGSGLFVLVNGKKEEIVILKDQLNPVDVLCINDEYQTIGTLGYKFKHVKTAHAFGWIRDKKGWWYLNKDGSYVKNKWFKLDTWYYFGTDGYAWHDRWELHTNGKWYYLGSDCRMKANCWIFWKKKWYRLKNDGSMACNETIVIGNKSQSFDSTGAWIE